LSSNCFSILSKYNFDSQRITAMKKVCMIHKVEPLDPRSFYKQSLSLKKAGYDVSLMSFFNESGIKDDIKLIKFKPTRKRLLRFINTNFNIFMKALRLKADIYHFHDLDFVPWAILLKIISRGKIIYDIHEAYPEYMLLKTYIPRLLRKIAYHLVYAIEHFGSLFFDAIITNDNFVLADFTHKQSEVIYNYPLLEFFTLNSYELPYKNRKFDIIFIGSLPLWHLMPMIETVEYLRERNYHYKWLLLPSQNSPRQLILSQIENRKLTDYFFVPESVPFTLVPRYLYDSRIGIIPIPPFKKYMKNIPLKMFEYMGCGLPIIASDLPPIRQFVDDRNCAILVKHDAAAYAKAIISLLENPANAEVMGNNGKKLVFEKYNWQNEEVKLLNIYDDLLKGA
jgi:glycosyltransferase involved in cell wall biosynthesis